MWFAAMPGCALWDLANVEATELAVVESAERQDGDVVCAAIVDGGDLIEIGMDDGLAVVLSEGLGPVGDVSSLARFDDRAAFCRAGGLTSVDLASGAIEEHEVPCSAAADVDDGLAVLDGPDLVTFASIDEAASGAPGARVPAPESVSRLGHAEAGGVWGAWHSDGKLLHRELPGGPDRSLHLLGWDTWIWGVSQAAGRVFVANDGRDRFDDAFQVDVVEFDTGGVPIRRVATGERGVHGLSCRVHDESAATASNPR